MYKKGDIKEGDLVWIETEDEYGYINYKGPGVVVKSFLRINNCCDVRLNKHFGVVPPSEEGEEVAEIIIEEIKYKL
jgi:hypothetical protein